MSNEYGFGRTFPMTVEDSVDAVTAALKAEGFGVLTQIDVQATLKGKIGVEYPAYRILGACNPHLAYRALQAEPQLGLLLPCNVIVYDNGDGTSTVNIVDPLQMLSVADNPALKAIASEADSRLHRVIDHLSRESVPA
jgi:uncharacterized protein (DUF302 family)